jgi:2-oxoglutarate ferredoxin oxidoreductase subunit beta
VRKYLREGLKLPFCRGCGNYTVISCFLRAVSELGYDDLRDFVFCSGIGCAAWIPSPYFKADSIHTPHGRAIPVAMGVKLARPELNVIVFGGDGDIIGIGSGHLLHAARRNADMMVVMVNNMVYGMTGGQVAPTTPRLMRTTTSPYGCFEYPVNAARLVACLNANYSARWTTAHAKELTKTFEEAIEWSGFRFVEVVSQCPTNLGRRVGKSAADMLRWFKEASVDVKEVRWTEEEPEGKILVGVFIKRRRKSLLENMELVFKPSGREIS